jgi:predicted tellurium resistance membrane protein TerC
MELLRDPQTWLSFATLALLEIVLGIDNILFLSLLVSRLPAARQAAARLLGLGFAMLTRIALLFSITWIATLTTPLLVVAGFPVSGRAAILGSGGLFLVIKSVLELRAMLAGRRVERRRGFFGSFWAIVLQIGIIDVVFSLDSVFTAVGLANHIEVMVAAIVCAVGVMMLISSVVSRFINRYPTLKVLALGFLLLIGASLIAEAFALEIPKGYLYFALAFSAVVEGLSIRTARRSRDAPGSGEEDA